MFAFYMVSAIHFALIFILYLNIVSSTISTIFITKHHLRFKHKRTLFFLMLSTFTSQLYICYFLSHFLITIRSRPNLKWNKRWWHMDMFNWKSRQQHKIKSLFHFGKSSLVIAWKIIAALRIFRTKLPMDKTCPKYLTCKC